jgi:hypothetical protein
MQAIVTKFLTGTDKYPIGRITARAQAGRLTIECRGGAPTADHKTAAMALVYRLGWGGYGKWIGSDMPDGTMVWSCVVKDEKFTASFDMAENAS